MSVSEIKKEKQREYGRKYDAKRALLPTFPKQRLTDEYDKKINELVKIYGTKKEVLLAGVDLLYENLKKEENKT